MRDLLQHHLDLTLAKEQARSGSGLLQYIALDSKTIHHRSIATRMQIGQVDVAPQLSTTAGLLMHGAHWLEGWSATQKVRALSSGELAFYSQSFGAARGLLMKHICREPGEPKKNTRASLLILLQVVAWQKDLGAGKCRRSEVKWLWLQQASDDKKLATKHVPTELNVADNSTTGLAQVTECGHWLT